MSVGRAEILMRFCLCEWTAGDVSLRVRGRFTVLKSLYHRTGLICARNSYGS
jgi:hypothetical protein